MNKIIKMLLLCGLFILLICPLTTKAVDNNTVIHYIFDKLEVKKDEEFTLTLLLEKYQDLSTVQFVCVVDTEVFTPIMKNNVYFVKPTLSLFDNSEIFENAYLQNEKMLRFVGITKGGKTYGYSSLNQVFTISFKCNKDIDDISEYFINDNGNNKGSSTVLIDKWAKTISCQISYNENLKTKWDVNKYEVEVFGTLPNITKDIEVLNRKSSEYEIEVVTEELDLTTIGTGVVKVKIYDYLTTQVIYLAKTIEILDRTSPVITVVQSEVIVNDYDILSNIFDYFVVSDNYDKNPKLSYRYFNNANQELASLNEFKNYLTTNLSGQVSCIASDSSGNKSEEVSVNIKIKDTTPPNINILTDLVVEDTKLDSFNFESLINMQDSYDKNPKLSYIVYGSDNKQYNSYLEALSQTYDIRIEYYAYDNSGNQSTKQTVKVVLKDTTPPSIRNVVDISIPDENLVSYLTDHNLLTKDFIITDNFTKELTVIKKYYYNSEEITEESFFNNLKKGLEGQVSYQVVDSYNNASEVVYQNVKVIDDTAPSVDINNIQNGGKYLGPLVVDYVVKDNLENSVDVVVLLNGEEYIANEIIILGNYTLIIEATDIFGNKTIKEVTFELVEENIFGCIDGMNCAENNYAIGIIIGIVIVSIVGIVVALEIIYVKKKKNSMPQD